MPSSSATVPGSEMAILRRIVDREEPLFSPEAARAILRLDFSAADRARMNELAAKNRKTLLTVVEDEELNNYIRVGQVLGIFKSKARKSLKSRRNGDAGKQ